MRFFNTAGPVNCQDHYCLPPLTRFDLSEIENLIRQKKYFILHAPRQTGKTSCLLALMKHLNAGGEFKALYLNVEAAQGARENVEGGIQAILYEMADRAEMYHQESSYGQILTETLEREGAYRALNSVLTRYADDSPMPAVLLLDEIDSLIGDTLISVLRQIRSGYDKRPRRFPQSIVLCGVRDVRDYRIHSSKQKEIITGGSAFNIKAESLRLGDFSVSEVDQLLECHTDETGQVFTREAKDAVWRLTQGQPWLVNALAYETCFRMKEYRGRTAPVDETGMMQAKENLILRRETHLDQLTDKLREERVRRVIAPILSGETGTDQFRMDDVQYVADLGLIRMAKNGAITIANPIYQEIIPRELSWNLQMGIYQETAWYVAEEGRLDIHKLLSSFQEFFREHSEHWVERFQYKEAGPQLLLQAFLQRVVNSGGRVEREYGLGRMRTDLLVIWPMPDGMQRAVIELKVKHKSLEKTISEGLTQTAAYMDRCATAEGHLVIFDRDEGCTWEEKIFKEKRTCEGKVIWVWGM